MTVGFNYRFGNILNLKEKLEVDKKQEFAFARKVFDDEKEKLNLLLEKKKAVTNKWNEITENNRIITIKELQSSSMNIKLVEDLVEQQGAVVKDKEKKLDKCKDLLMEAKKQKKIFEKLKEKDYEQFKALTIKNENSLVDQLITYKSTLKKGG